MLGCVCLIPIRCLSGDVTLGFREEVQTGVIYIHIDTYTPRYVYMCVCMCISIYNTGII